MNKEELNYTEMLFNRDERLIKIIYDLQEENEKCTRKHWQSKCAEYSIKNRLLQNKIDKVIEMMKLIIKLNGITTAKGLQKYVDILEGEDNEQNSNIKN